MPTESPNTTAFHYIMTERDASASQVRSAARSLDVDYRDLSEDAVEALLRHFEHNPTPQFIHNNTEEPTVPTPKPAAQPARKRQGDTTRTTKRAAQEGISAAQVARDAGIDPRRFRAFLRSQGIDRTFARKADATKAVKAFGKANA